jgi:hypothetical protein
MMSVELSMLQLRYQARWAIPLAIMALLLGSACTPSPSTPPTPPPSPPPVPSPSGPENHPPIIHYMTADQEITLSSNAQIQCVATDKDKDTLSYQWSADGGVIAGTADNVTWTPPDSVGDYTIQVAVTDGEGGEAVDSVTITVALKLNQPPTIISLTAEEEQVSQWETTTIECVAQDPDGDELSFAWSATDGPIAWEGARARWTAPGRPGDFAVIVTVTDGRGGETVASVYLEVPCHDCER